MLCFLFKCSWHGHRCIVPLRSCCTLPAESSLDLHFFIVFPPSFFLSLRSGASRATASGDPASSLRATMGTGAPGPSWAPAPERAEEECAPAAGSATTHREEINKLFFNDL